MHSLKPYWQQLLASIRKRSPSRREQCPEALRHEIAVLTVRNRALSAARDRLCTDFEQARAEEHRKRAELEQRCEASEAVRARDRNRLDALERQVGANESEYRQTRGMVATLEAALAGHRVRLDRTDQHVEVLEALGRERASACNEALARTAARLGEAEDHVRSAELQLASTHRSLAAGQQEMQVALARHARRLDASLTGAGIALVLGMAAGALLIRDVQNNSRVIAGMSSDMKVLLTSFDQYLDTRHGPAQPPPVTLPPPAPAAETPGPPVPRPVPARETPPVIPAPAPPWEAQTATAGKRDANRYFLGSDLDLFLQMNNRGNPAATRRVSAGSTGDNARPEAGVEPPSGLQYQVVTAGSGKTPTLADRVVLDYLGTTPDGTIIADTYAAGTPVTCSMNQLAPGWQGALLLMQEGAEWGLYVPPRFAQQRGADASGMPGNAPGYYLIKLLQVIEGEGRG